MIIRLIFSFLLKLICNYVTANGSEGKEYLTKLACKKNPTLSICVEPEDENILVTPPPIPMAAIQKDDLRRRKSIEDRSNRKNEFEQMDAKLGGGSEKKKIQRFLTQEEAAELKAKCDKMSPVFQENCQKDKTLPGNKGRCEAYVRDCYRFMKKGDPLQAIANCFSSAVNINLATVEVNGIPYYPINEEGGVGVGVGLSAPFEAWGGGYSDSVGVRDYWSQHQEVGANWVEGKYGYKNGWSVPLVQSLGIEGGQHNTVSVPLTGKDAGRIQVDNGYNVGGYYGHIDHVGVDWKGGNVQHTFGVGSPFVGAGFDTGQAVAFPGLDVWQRALGRK